MVKIWGIEGLTPRAGYFLELNVYLLTYVDNPRALFLVTTVSCTVNSPLGIPEFAQLRTLEG